jgi:hypothetical protein
MERYAPISLILISSTYICPQDIAFGPIFPSIPSQHITISLMSTSTVRNSIHFHFLYLVFTSLHVSAYVEAIFRCGF